MDTLIPNQATAPRRRPRNPRGQGERLREEILDAADALLAESGDARQLSLRGVAKRAGIAATSIYLQFADVEQLKAAVVERAFTELNEVRDAASQGIADTAEAMPARSRAYAHWAVDHPGLYRLMFGPDLPSAMAYGAEQSPSQHSFQALVQSIERCQEVGVVDPRDDPMQVAALMWAAVHGLVTLRMDRPHFPWRPLDEMVNETVGRLLGLGPMSIPHSGGST